MSAILMFNIDKKYEDFGFSKMTCFILEPADKKLVLRSNRPMDVKLSEKYGAFVDFYKYSLVNQDDVRQATIFGKPMNGPVIIYQKDERGKTVSITEEGVKEVLENTKISTLTVSRGEMRRLNVS